MMIDANIIMLILTLLTVGFLALATLWGFFAGVRRELQCLAVFIFLFAIAWLTFSDPIKIVDSRLLGSIIVFVNRFVGFVELPTGASTLREISVCAASQYVSQLAEVLADKTSETYNFFINFVGSAARMLLLLISTWVAIYLVTIIRAAFLLL